MSHKVSKKSNKVYKSLFEVKDKYLPNATLDFLEGKNNDLARDTFMLIQKKVTPPVDKPDSEY